MNASATFDRAALQAALRQEVETLHAFITAWFNGTIPNTKQVFEEEFTARLAPELINIQPAGHVLTRDELVSAIYDGHATNPDFTIKISRAVLRWHDISGGRALLTYIEHQSGARNTAPPTNDRISSVLFDITNTSARPRWLHIHETALT